MPKDFYVITVTATDQCTAAQLEADPACTGLTSDPAEVMVRLFIKNSF